MAQARKTSNGAASPEQSLSEQVAILKSDFKDFASVIEGIVGERKDELTALGARKAGEAATMASDAVAAVGDNAVQARDTTVEAIRQRPLTALAVSAGIGLLVGMLSARKS